MCAATAAHHRLAETVPYKRGLRRWATLFAAVALACVLAALVGSPSARAESLCTDTWTGPAEGAWTTASNWSAAHVPASTDVACIGSGKVANVGSGTNQTGVVQGDGTLSISGGSLEVINALEVSSIHGLTIKGGTLTGAATVNVNAAFSWVEGGTMSGPGKTVVASGVAGLMEGGSCSELYLKERTFVNEGTLTFTGAVFGLSEGGRFETSGTFKANSESSCLTYPVRNEGGTTAPVIVNTGTFQKTAGSKSTALGVRFENHGVVSPQIGVLAFHGGGSSNSSAEWAPATGSSVQLTEGSYAFSGGRWANAVELISPGPSVTVAGVNATSAQLTVEAGSIAFEGGAVTAEGLTLKSGTLTGPGTLEVSKAFAWLTNAGSATMSGSGKTIIDKGVSGTIEGLNCDAQFLRARTLVNEGSLTFSGSEIRMSEGARLENKGTFKANSESTCLKYAIIAETPAPSPTIVNTGLFEKTAGTGITIVQPTFENNRSIEAKSGKLEFLAPVAREPGTQYGGGQNPSVPGQRHSECGGAVGCATGNESQAHTDFAIGGRGVGLNLTRTYNSQAAAEGAKGAFGYGWTLSFGDRLVVEPTNKRATLYQSTGSTVPFTEGTGGSYTAPSWSPDTLSGSSEAGYTITLPSQVKYHFAGSSGRLETVTDRNSNTTTLSYSEAGRLEAITDPAGRKLTLAYNAEGLIESAKDPMGHEVKYGYEASNLASVTLPGETAPNWQFKYDTSHQMTTQTDGRGGKTTREYNAAHQVTSETDPMARTLSFEYEPFHTRITNKATGAVTDEHFTSNDEPSSITRGYGSASATTESFTYNEAGYTTGVTDGNGHATQYTYDAENNRTSVLDAAEQETKSGYNATRDVISTTTPRGETTTIKRDSHGNAEQIERPAPAAKTQVTKYKYDASGNLETVTDPLERVWKYEYNSHGDRTGQTDPAGDKRTWGYDEDSQATTTVSPRGHVKAGEEATYTTKIERDAQGRPLTITNPVSKTNKRTYDANGNVATAVDAKTDTTTYTYDADNELTKVKEPNGTVTATGYDGAGRVTSQTDGNTRVTKDVRDIIGEITEVVDPLLRKTTREYDLAGNVKTVTDPTKRVATYTFDPVNRLTEVSYSDGKTPAVKYEYDADGDRTKMIDGTGTTTYVYDQLDRLTETKDGHGDLSSYEYDLADQQTKITYPNGKAVTRSYDAAGRLQTLTDWLEHTTKFGYDADFDPTATTYPTGTTNEDTYKYNAADQQIETKVAKGAEALATLKYTRDANGGLLNTKVTGLPGEAETKDTYDKDSRLTKSGTGTYEYDPANNATLIPGSTNTYDAASQLEKGTGVTYSYDELGERTKRTPTSGPATTYGYDQAGDLTSVTRPKEGETAAIEDGYGYDGDGLRMSETIGATTAYLSWETTGGLPSVLSDGSSSYIYGPGGVPVEQIASGGAITYLHHDQQGSTRLLTGSLGTSTGTFTYDAYGNQTGHTGTATTPLGYDGQYTSSDTGLIYLRARVYDPATAQFLTVDPLVSVTDAPYTYARDSPLNNGDPTGLLCLDPTGQTCGRLESKLASEADSVIGGAANGLTGGLIEAGNTCSTGYTIGQYGSLLGLLLPEEWGTQVLSRVAKVFPRVSDLILKVQTNRRVTEPGSVKIVIATVEWLKHLL